LLVEYGVELKHAIHLLHKKQDDPNLWWDLKSITYVTIDQGLEEMKCIILEGGVGINIMDKQICLVNAS
jgi:hypothetical protein